MYILGKDKTLAISKILPDSYYLEFVNFFKGLLKKSRSKQYNNPIGLLAIQKVLQLKIAQGNIAIREGKERLRKARAKNNTKEIGAMERQILTNRMVLHIARAIADGIAWRVLGFDRPVLRMMAEAKRYPGSIDLDGYAKVAYDYGLEIISKRKSIVVLNDITNFLRIGDITEVGERTIISELKVKTSKKKRIIVKNMYEIAMKNKKNLSWQELKIAQVQVARDFRKVAIPNTPTIPIADLPIPFQNNLPEVNELIKKSRIEGVATVEFGQYLFVRCTDFETMYRNHPKDSLEFTKQKDKKPKWLAMDKWFAISNYDSFYNEKGDFPRNITPYAIFPFNEQDCIDLISGRLHLIAYINYTEIKRILESAGWDVSFENLEKQLKENEKMKGLSFSGLAYEHSVDTNIFSVSKGPFMCKVPLNWVVPIAIDFMKPETLVEMLESLYRRAEANGSQTIQPFISGEKKVWR